LLSPGKGLILCRRGPEVASRIGFSASWGRRLNRMLGVLPRWGVFELETSAAAAGPFAHRSIREGSGRQPARGAAGRHL